MGYTGFGPGLLIAGANNTYSTGTNVHGIVTVAANSSLGTGGVTVEQGILHLTAATNLAAGKKVLLTGGGVALDYTGDPTAIIDPASVGSLLLDLPMAQGLDMATLGNGMMTLGTTTNSSYTASFLLPGVDHVYRFAALMFRRGRI